LEHTDCGMISPKTRMKAVESTAPTAPAVRSAVKMAMKELTAVLPSRRVQSKRFP